MTGKWMCNRPIRHIIMTTYLICSTYCISICVLWHQHSPQTAAHLFNRTICSSSLILYFREILTNTDWWHTKLGSQKKRCYFGDAWPSFRSCSKLTKLFKMDYEEIISANLLRGNIVMPDCSDFTDWLSLVFQLNYVGHKRHPYLQHSKHHTISMSPELKECATRPQSYSSDQKQNSRKIWSNIYRLNTKKLQVKSEEVSGLLLGLKR